MSKLVIFSVVAFLLVFTAGFAAAKTTPVCTSTECNETGTLHFVSVASTTVNEVQNVQLTLNLVTGTHFWTGTLVIPTNSVGVPAGTINISAIKAAFESDDPHLFYDIAGTDATSSQLILQAAGENNAHGTSSGEPEFGFGIHGTIHSSTFDGSFHGPLFPVSSTTE